MKQKQNGSAHVILLGIIVILISGTLTHFLLQALDNKPSAEPIKQQSGQIAAPVKKPEAVKNQTYAESSDWKVRFPTSTKYTLKRNSGTGNMAGYWISIDSLAQTCTTPDTPWLGFISQYTPSDVVENGPDAGKTFGQVFGKQGMTIDGKLYVFKVTSQVCTRNKSNPAVEQAAEKLKSEIQNLEAY
jgi:hypothetical protein